MSNLVFDLQLASRVSVGHLVTILLNAITYSYFRYRTSNLLCTSILPGPKEQTPDEIQRYLRPIVSDLLRLWREGLVLPTESRPEGSR
jgi:hypothetical protein